MIKAMKPFLKRMSGRIFGGIIFLAVALFAPQFSQAQGTAQVSNLGQAQNGGRLIGSNAWVGQSFITGTDSSGYILDSVQLLMVATSGSSSGFNVSIYSSLNGRPETAVANLVGPDPSAGGIFGYTASGLTLSPSTLYFVVATAATTAAFSAYEWSSTDGIVDLGNEQWTIYNSFADSPDGSNWGAVTGRDDFQMALYATPAPEPDTIGLFAAGGLLVVFRRRKAKWA